MLAVGFAHSIIVITPPNPAQWRYATPIDSFVHQTMILATNYREKLVEQVRSFIGRTIIGEPQLSAVSQNCTICLALVTSGAFERWLDPDIPKANYTTQTTANNVLYGICHTNEFSLVTATCVAQVLAWNVTIAADIFNGTTPLNICALGPISQC